jgi:hypothetical protein
MTVTTAVSTPAEASRTEGCLVEVCVATIGARNRQVLFAAAFADPIRAETAVRDVLGGLHCSVQVRCPFSRRALDQLGVKAGEILQLCGP